MNYITNVAGMPFLYGYRRNSYTHKYITSEPQGHRERLSRQYIQSYSPVKLAEYHYFLLSPRAKVQGLAHAKHRQDLVDWVSLLYQTSMPYSNNHKEVAVKNSQKMTFELKELKTEGGHYEFIIRESIMDNIVTWECLPDADTIKEYLKKHPFPRDELYPEKTFLEDVEKATGYIHLVVEKRETAEFICDLCSALI